MEIVFVSRKLKKELTNGDVLVANLEIHSLGQEPYFIVTGELYDRSTPNGERYIINSKNRKRYLGSCGQLAEDIKDNIPSLKRYVKYHLISTEGPMYYISNTLYHIKNNNLDAARSTAIWLDAKDKELLSSNIKERLINRLPKLMEEFWGDMEVLFPDLDIEEVKSYKGRE